MKKKSMKIDETRLANQLQSSDMVNWLIIEGIKKHREGKKLGVNMTTFLEIMGILKSEE